MNESNLRPKFHTQNVKLKYEGSNLERTWKIERNVQIGHAKKGNLDNLDSP